MDMKQQVIAALLRAKQHDLANMVAAVQVTAGKKQVIFLGNTGPNGAPEWVVVWYRNTNGDGTGPIMRITPRLGIEPDINKMGREQFYGDPKGLAQYMGHMRPRLSRQGIILLNKMTKANTSSVTAQLDQHMVDELQLYIDNEHQLYRQRQAIEENLTRKWKKGRYDHTKAPKLWMYLVDNAAKQYIKEFMSPGTKIHIATRRKAAQELADDWQKEAKQNLGEPGALGMALMKTSASFKSRPVKDKKVQQVLNKSYPYLDEAQDAGQSVFRNAKVQVGASNQNPFYSGVVFKEGRGWWFWAPVPGKPGKKMKMGPYSSKGRAEETKQDMEEEAGASTKRVQAGTWQEQAKAELEAELGGIETEYGRLKGRDYFTLESSSGRANNGESEWMVFKDAKSAERYAVEYVQEQLDDDPSMFNQKWLKQHVYISPNDIRIISQEDADNYVDDIRYESEERLLDEAKMLKVWESLEDKKDALNDKLMAEIDPKKQAVIQKQIDKMEDAQSKLVDKADEKLRAEMAKQTADELKKDPLRWAEDLGYDMGKNRPPWLQIDTRKAAQDAVDNDGVAHFLDGYDGEEIECPNGAVAFGTN